MQAYFIKSKRVVFVDQVLKRRSSDVPVNKWLSPDLCLTLTLSDLNYLTKNFAEVPCCLLFWQDVNEDKETN